MGLEMGSEKGFQWAGFGGCGGGLVGVEGVWWAWRSHLLHPWRIRPTPVSLRPPNLIKLTNAMDLYSFTVKHANVNKFEENSNFS